MQEKEYQHIEWYSTEANNKMNGRLTDYTKKMTLWMLFDYI